MRKETLTVEELKSLILARSRAEQSKQTKLQERIQSALGQPAQKEGAGDAAFKNKVIDWISDLLARRLKRNRRTVPLLSSRDFTRFFSFILDTIAQMGIELEAAERKNFKKDMKGIFKNVLETIPSMVPRGKNHYEVYWRWARTVFDLAAERGVPPTELLALESATDEITRRLFTKKQFLNLHQRLMKSPNADVKKLIIQWLGQEVARIYAAE